MDKVRRLVRVPEVAVFLFATSVGINGAIFAPFVYRRVCEWLVASASAPVSVTPTSSAPAPAPASAATFDRCDNVSDDAALLAGVETASARLMLASQLVGCLLALALSVGVASWADARGRKPPLLVCLSGQAVSQFALVVVAGLPRLPPAFVLLPSVVSGASGHALVVIGLFFTMVADATPSRAWLTVRIGVASGVLSAGYLHGNVLSGHLLPLVGFGYVAVVSTGFCTLAVVHAAALLRETLVRTPRPEQAAHDDVPRAATAKHDPTGGRRRRRCASAKRLLAAVGVRDYFDTLCRHRDDRRRFYLHISLALFFTVFTCDSGLPGLQLLFLKLPPLSFSDSLYAISLACRTASTAVGIMFFPYVFRLLHRRDTLMIVVGLAASTAKMLLFAFSSNRAMVYTSFAMSGIASIYFPGFRSFASKLVERSESARIFAIMSSLEHLSPLLSAVVFGNLFPLTLAIDPSIVFYVSAAIQLATCCCMGWVHYASGELFHLEQAESSSVERVLVDETSDEGQHQSDSIS